MQSKDADKYGIHVFISSGIVTSPEIMGVQYQQNSKGNWVATGFYGNASRCETAVKTMNSLKTLFDTKYCFKMLVNGDYVMYTREEAGNVDAFTEDTKWYLYNPNLGKKAKVDIPPENKKDIPQVAIDKALMNLDEYTWSKVMAYTKTATSDGKLDLTEGEAKLNTVALERLRKDIAEKNILPAVYNITTDALCTIVCPFFLFINPFDTVYFSSRYSLGGLVSYYANFGASEDEFTILWQDISFATVEDINECTMVATGRRTS